MMNHGKTVHTESEEIEMESMPRQSEEINQPVISEPASRAKLTAAVKTNRGLRLRIQQQQQAQTQERQNKSQSAAMPFVTTGVLNCTLIANSVDGLANCIDKVSIWSGRQVLLLLTIILLLLVQFGIVGVLSYLFCVGSSATTISEDFSEGGIDKAQFEKESRRLRRLRNVLHAAMLVLSLNTSVLEVIYLSLSRDS
jgi:hypothetical protein